MDFDYSDSTVDFRIVFDMYINREHIEIEEDFHFSFSCICSIFCCLRDSFSASSKGDSFGRNCFGCWVILQKDWLFTFFWCTSEFLSFCIGMVGWKALHPAARKVTRGEKPSQHSWEAWLLIEDHTRSVLPNILEAQWEWIIF